MLHLVPRTLQRDVKLKSNTVVDLPLDAVVAVEGDTDRLAVEFDPQRVPLVLGERLSTYFIVLRRRGR